MAEASPPGMATAEMREQGKVAAGGSVGGRRRWWLERRKEADRARRRHAQRAARRRGAGAVLGHWRGHRDEVQRLRGACVVGKDGERGGVQSDGEVTQK